jgi:RNA polymerase sporulation-specific sigma factor
VPGLIAALALFIKELMLLVSYVKNNAFPQPLSEEEEEYHLKRMAEGDTESRNKLIEHNLRLVAHIVKKFDNTGEDLEDLISIGTIGLIKAIENFSPDKGTKLATFASRCVENEILMHLRSLKKTRKDVSLHDPIGTDKEGNELTLKS